MSDNWEDDVKFGPNEGGWAGADRKPPSVWAHELHVRPLVLREAVKAKGWNPDIIPNVEVSMVSREEFEEGISAVPHRKVRVVVPSRPEYLGYWSAGRFLPEGSSVILVCKSEYLELAHEQRVKNPITLVEFVPEETPLSAPPHSSKPLELTDEQYLALLGKIKAVVKEEALVGPDGKEIPKEVYGEKAEDKVLVRTTKRTTTTKGPLGAPG